MRTKGLFVTGISTEVGKTVASAVLVKALDWDYWKPVQSGDLDHTDSMKVEAWSGLPNHRIHPEAYRLGAPMSPHASAELDGLRIDMSQFDIPHPEGEGIIVEGAGGLWVPLNEKESMLDLMTRLQLPVVLVSRHYLGSINHTLLSLEALDRRGIRLAGLVWSGDPNPTTEGIITQWHDLGPTLRIPDLGDISPQNIAEVAENWKGSLKEWTHAIN